MFSHFKIGFIIAACVIVAGCGRPDFLYDERNQIKGGLYKVAVEVRNVSIGSQVETPLTRGVWAVHKSHKETPGNPFYTVGLFDASMGLEDLVEDGLAELLLDNISLVAGVASQGTIGKRSDPIVLPEEQKRTLKTVFYAKAADRFSLIIPLMQFNDTFLATPEQGFPITYKDAPFKVDITDHLSAYDAGTEQSQPPGLGSDQMLRQPSAKMGIQTRNPITQIEQIEPKQIVKVTLSVEEVSSPY